MTPSWVHARERVLTALSTPDPSLVVIKTIPAHARDEEQFIQQFFDFCADNEGQLKFTIGLVIDFALYPRDDDQILAHIIATLKNSMNFKFDRTSTLLLYYWSLFKPFITETSLSGGVYAKNADLVDDAGGATLGLFIKGLSSATEVIGEYGGSIAKGAHKLGKVALKRIREKKYVPSKLLFERYPLRYIEALWESLETDLTQNVSTISPKTALFLVNVSDNLARASRLINALATANIGSIVVTGVGEVVLPSRSSLAQTEIILNGVGANTTRCLTYDTEISLSDRLIQLFERDGEAFTILPSGETKAQLLGHIMDALDGNSFLFLYNAVIAPGISSVPPCEVATKLVNQQLIHYSHGRVNLTQRLKVLLEGYFDRRVERLTELLISGKIPAAIEPAAIEDLCCRWRLVSHIPRQESIIIVLERLTRLPVTPSKLEFLDWVSGLYATCWAGEDPSQLYLTLLHLGLFDSLLRVFRLRHPASSDKQLETSILEQKVRLIALKKMEGTYARRIAGYLESGIFGNEIAIDIGAPITFENCVAFIAYLFSYQLCGVDFDFDDAAADRKNEEGAFQVDTGPAEHFMLLAQFVLTTLRSEGRPETIINEFRTIFFAATVKCEDLSEATKGAFFDALIPYFLWLRAVRFASDNKEAHVQMALMKRRGFVPFAVSKAVRMFELGRTGHEASHLSDKEREEIVGLMNVAEFMKDTKDIFWQLFYLWMLMTNSFVDRYEEAFVFLRTVVREGKFPLRTVAGTVQNAIVVGAEAGCARGRHEDVAIYLDIISGYEVEAYHVWPGFTKEAEWQEALEGACVRVARSILTEGAWKLDCLEVLVDYIIRRDVCTPDLRRRLANCLKYELYVPVFRHLCDILKHVPRRPKTLKRIMRLAQRLGAEAQEFDVVEQLTAAPTHLIRPDRNDMGKGVSPQSTIIK